MLTTRNWETPLIYHMITGTICLGSKTQHKDFLWFQGSLSLLKLLLKTLVKIFWDKAGICPSWLQNLGTLEVMLSVGVTSTLLLSGPLPTYHASKYIINQIPWWQSFADTSFSSLVTLGTLHVGQMGGTETRIPYKPQILPLLLPNWHQQVSIL